MNMDIEKKEQEIRELLVMYGKKLVLSGLVQGTWGNLSIKFDNQYMLVTPSGLDYNRLTPGDMVKVDMKTLKYSGDNKPTSEKGLHAVIYNTRSDVGAVIHTHSKYCSVFAAANKPIPIEDIGTQKIFGKEVGIGKYALPGTKGLMKNTISALGSNMACIMAKHGMACCGKDIEEAFSNCVNLEKYAEKYIESRYLKLNI